ncbi:hypothetical protein LCGC14_1969080 [marine sediment metagenome]|uniref:DUF1848 domain-containing protein n=1 Tax=marine sediment metagenome TaxID=412755 RepID=A0A0F9G0J5_9ZZZZ|nr:DUF1848 family protein [archaeon]
MKQVISFSRRTDGVAFYINRLEKAIEEGNIEVRNPFNNKISNVSLKPQDVAGFVLWSKNFNNFLSKWEIFKKYKAKNTLITDTKIPIYFHFTRNSIVKILEPFSPALEESFSQMRELVEITSPEHIMWRFDPIVFWIEDGHLNDNIKDFSEIAAQFSDIGLKKCTISFATYYKKVEHRMLKYSFHHYKPTVKEMIKTTQELVIKAKKHDIKIFVCCNPDLLKIPDISQAHCIDGNYLSKLWNIKLSLARDTGQREVCGCTKSRDIGGYNKEWKCHHACLYCYASPAIH